MTIQQRISRILSFAIIAGLCITPEMLSAQNTQPAPPSQASTTNQQSQADQQKSGTKIDPAKAPLQPVTTYPDASGEQQKEPEPQNNTQQPQTTTTTEQVPDTPQPKKSGEPVGAAAAEKVPTQGGAASKPAGVAIAPAKQHQTRSLLIKIGAIAAAGVAAGTIYALSRGTPSTPPNTATPGATQK